jgi:hypothetical protein
MFGVFLKIIVGIANYHIKGWIEPTGVKRSVSWDPSRPVNHTCMSSNKGGPAGKRPINVFDFIPASPINTYKRA